MNERPPPKQPFKPQFREVQEPKMGRGLGPLVVRVVMTGILALVIGFVAGNRARQPRETDVLKERLTTVEQRSDDLAVKVEEAGGKR